MKGAHSHGKRLFKRLLAERLPAVSVEEASNFTHINIRFSWPNLPTFYSSHCIKVNSTRHSSVEEWTDSKFEGRWRVIGKDLSDDEVVKLLAESSEPKNEDEDLS